MLSLGRWIAVLLIWLVPGLAGAGLHYSGEKFDDLPSQWRGFMTDLRALRNIAVKPSPALPVNPMRQQYEEEVQKLRDAARSRKLTADEQADLGALLIRLGEMEAALAILREAQREHTQHFRVVANLGTAWHVYGELERAAEALRQAVALAPEKLRRAEEFHLRLVRLRQREPRGSQELDDLFGVRFVGESGRFEPGRLAAAERQKLPADAVAIAQQLALWLPADARLFWLLGELANAHGDVRTAGEILETCVAQFGLSARTLREHRVAVRESAAELTRLDRPGSESARAEHAAHAGAITVRSKRPLASRRVDLSKLPAITKSGVNPLPWAVLLDTAVDRNFRPTFPKHLQGLHDLDVSMTGFMQPLTDDLELNAFMLIEYPTGCWYCEVPEVTGIVLVELPEGRSTTFSRDMVKVTGKLSLNANDPENFLYTIKAARVGEAD